MFDIGWTELMLIGVVALIVIGPKDLPEMFRTLGRFTAKLRSMSRDFSRAMEQAAKESGVKDVANDLKAATSPSSLGLNAVKDAAAKFEKWDPLKSAKPAAPAAPAKPAMGVTLPAGDKAVVAPAIAAPAAAEPAAAQTVVAPPVAAPAPTPITTPDKPPAKAPAKPRAVKAAPTSAPVTAAVDAPEPVATAAAKKPRAPRKKAQT